MAEIYQSINIIWPFVFHTKDSLRADVPYPVTRRAGGNNRFAVNRETFTDVIRTLGTRAAGIRRSKILGMSAHGEENHPKNQKNCAFHCAIRRMGQ
jgi:hypothetical protein